MDLEGPESLPGEPLLFSEERAQVRTQGLLLHLAAWVVGLLSVSAALVWLLAGPICGIRLPHLLPLLGAGALGGLVVLGAVLVFLQRYVVPRVRGTHRTMQRLERTALHALAATRLKSEFLANMSHEIRTPMNGVLTMSNLLVRANLDGHQLRLAEIIRTSARSLLTILDDVLDFSKIEAGKYDISPAPFDVRLAVRDVIELLAPRAHDKGIELAYRVLSNVPRVVQNDVDRFRQVVTNLVGNAVKFTERGQVVVTVDVLSRNAEHALLMCTVVDSGPGISGDDLQKLFVSFSQVDTARSRKHGGTGLGLAISQSFAHLMGGEITVESKLGEGSTFRFSITCKVVEEFAPTGLSVAAGKRVLLVDGNAPTCAVLADQLMHSGLRTESVTTALDAMIALETAIMAGAPFEAVFVAEPLMGGGAVELANAIAKSNVPTAVALLVSNSGVGAPNTQLPSELPVLAKPLRESEVFDFLRRAFEGPADQAEAAPRTAHRVSLPARGGHVLAVDDNEINQAVALELLRELGYTMDIANDGLEALAAVKRGGYDAVLMDCQMPVLDGYQATREIRAWEAAEAQGRVPIIALTAHAIAGERDKALAAGMDDYLTKPIVSASLERALARQLTSEASAHHSMRPRRTAQTTSRSRPVVTDPPQRTVSSPGTSPLLDGTVHRSAKVSELFLELVPTQLQGLLMAAREGATEQLTARAHKLRGGCTSIGARAMSELCRVLEEATVAHDLAAARQHVEALHSLFEATATQLQSELTSGAHTS